MTKTNFDLLLEEELKDPCFVRGFERAGLELDLALGIAFRRQDLGLSQKELAERVGTSQQQISRLEQAGYRGSIKTLYRVADALGLEVEIRLKERDKPPAKPASRRQPAKRARTRKAPVAKKRTEEIQRRHQ